MKFKLENTNYIAFVNGDLISIETIIHSRVFNCFVTLPSLYYILDYHFH